MLAPLSRSSMVRLAPPGQMLLMRPVAATMIRPLAATMTRHLSAPTSPKATGFGDHSWRQQNHIWSEDEIQERMLTADDKHSPQTFAESILQTSVRAAYHTFNLATGYNHVDPPTSAIGYRLIILESIAGVPGMLGGMFRHFRSLRQLERDHGFIFTLLEEAENERMHLIVCMSFFEAGPVTRFLVQAGQVALTPFLASLYMIRPQLLHRFVGYLEETAVHTCACKRPFTNALAPSLPLARSRSPTSTLAARAHRGSDGVLPSCSIACVGPRRYEHCPHDSDPGHQAAHRVAQHTCARRSHRLLEAAARRNVGRLLEAHARRREPPPRCQPCDGVDEPR